MSIEKITEKFESVVDYNTKLSNFDGPLDLLLYLVKQSEIEIKDIFVSEVTDQFLQYINSVDELDIEKASEYLSKLKRKPFCRLRRLTTRRKRKTRNKP